MRKPIAFVVLVVTIAVAIPIAIAMAFMGANHTFSVDRGAIYYAIDVGLGVGSAFAIPISWGILADDDEDG